MTETTIDTLRALSWDEYVGQPLMKERINHEVLASIESETPFPHTLLSGPPGSGKTTLAAIIADSLGDKFMSLIMPVDQSFLEGVIWEFQGILFLDEIHRASKRQQESLLTLLESGYMQSKGGLRIESAWLTIVAATTKPQMIDPAVENRFMLRPAFEAYTEEDMAEIIAGMASKVKDVDLRFTPEHLAALGKASGGRPRSARALVLAARTLSINRGEAPTVEQILRQADVDSEGLSARHINYLQTLKRFNGVAGLSRIASVTMMSPQAIQELEGLLLERGYLDITERGRQLTSKGHLRVTTGSATYKRERKSHGSLTS